MIAAKWTIFRKVTKINCRKIAAAVLVFLLSVDYAFAAVFHVVYIEAGEGNSSGGHLAVQLGENVFHYQYENGMIRLFNNHANAFLEEYRFRQNRSLHIADVTISDNTAEQLTDYFNLRLFSQKQHLKKLQNLQQDQRLLQAFLNQKSANQKTVSSVKDDSLQIDGAGLFFNDLESDSPKTSDACDTSLSSARIAGALKRRIAIDKGENSLSDKINALRKEINQLSPSLENLDISSYQYAYSEHYGDLLTGLLALTVLQDDQPLATHACFQIVDPKLRLNDSDIKNAELFKKELFRTAQSLIVSKRPDWGYALFVTLARLIVIDHSIQNRQWTFLFDDENNTKELTREQIALYAKRMLIQRRTDLEQLQHKANEINQSSGNYERRYVELELAANRYHHWLESDATGRLKFRSEQPLPIQSISSTRFLTTELTIDQLKIALAHRNLAEESLLKNDIKKNTYNLVTKNCVSALFKLIDEAVDGRSKEQLGGYIDPEINFVPFQAFESVENTYNVTKTNHLPAYRQQQLARLYAQENESLVYLRESNIFSSSLYNYNVDDAWFVFFTDDQILPRPLFGVFNIAAAASQSLFGLFYWPFDGGNNIKTGVRGILASFPELAFFNIRKGSYPYSIEAVN